jgi:hypothetical protein
MTEDIARDKQERMMQEARCRKALSIIEVPNEIIWMFDGPILFQLAHLCCFIDQPMHWRDALRWCHDHKDEIGFHARRTMIEKQQFTTSEGQGEASDDASKSRDQGQSLRVGDGSVPVGSEEHSS